MRAAVALLALSGCSTLFGIEEPGKLRDAGDGNESVMTGDGRECWGTDIDICIRPAPSAPKNLSGNLDTGMDTMCTVVEDGLCIVAGTDVTVGALAVSGSRPLVIVASNVLTVGGILDAASHRGTKRGPGVGAATCPQFMQTPSFQLQTGFAGGGGGGGAGGSFVFRGGNGAASITGSQIGISAPATAAAFRAGCPGQNGAIRTGTGALGGDGGGAVYLIAGTRIDVTDAGRINASGAGGAGGACANCGAADLRNSDAYGGGGGGSGGAIVLEAPSIVLAPAAIVFADGGGGGQGASRSLAGESATEPTGAMAARGGLGADNGGSGPNNGGNGGTGSHTALPAIGLPGADGEDSPGGAGGAGGGGGGYVKRIGTVTGSGKISPP